MTAARHLVVGAVLVVAALVLAIVPGPASPVEVLAQAGCTPPPSVPGKVGWRQHYIVPYNLSALPANIRQTAVAAMDKWKADLAAANKHVNFTEVSDPADAADDGIVFTVGRAEIFKNGQWKSYPAKVDSVYYEGGRIKSATVTMDLNNVGGTFFDSSRPEYLPFIRKIVLHEVGHTLSLDEVPGPISGQARGGSALNGAYGVNDRQGNMAMNPSPCDINTAWIIPLLSVGRPPVGGGEQGGAGENDFRSEPEVGAGCHLTDDCDGDGWKSWEDCDDENWYVHPYVNQEAMCSSYHWIGDINMDVSCDGVSEESVCTSTSSRLLLVDFIPDEEEPGSGPGSGRWMSLMADNGQYVVAEGNGGGDVNANRSGIGLWETFELIDLNGGDLMDGDEVALRTESGWYLQALDGGGGGLRATGSGAGAWETFTIRVESGSDSRVDSWEEVALQADSGHYVVAESGGGDVVNANRTSIGAWEVFRIIFH